MSELYKTKGIILHTIKYGDKGHIVYMLTEKLGRVSYWVNSSRGGKPTVAKSKIIIQPLTIIDYVAKTPTKGDLHRFVELSKSYYPSNVIFDYTKSTLALFITELVYRFIKTDTENTMIYDYVEHSIKTLDTIQEGIPNFHIYFILNLTRFLGYYPSDKYIERSFFDLTRGEYVIIRPQHNLYIEQKESEDLSNLQQKQVDMLAELKYNKSTRNTLIEAMIAYINYHNGTNIKISSTEILKELF